MFEPENDIERMLMRAATEPAERPGFARALMDAEIYLVFDLGGAPIARAADGSLSLPEGATLTLQALSRGDESFIPFFTAPVRAHAVFKTDHVVSPDTARDLFGRYPEASFVLNPGSAYGKEFTPAEVKRLLAGQFDDGPQTTMIDEPEQILLVHPKDVPHALIAALGKEFGDVPSIKGAWLMLAQRASEPDQTWMLGVDCAGPWHEVESAIDRALQGDVLAGRPLDFVKIDNGEVSSTLRTGIPIAAPKRGFLKKLFS